MILAYFLSDRGVVHLPPLDFRGHLSGVLVLLSSILQLRFTQTCDVAGEQNGGAS